MSWNTGGYNLSPFNVVILSPGSYLGLQLLKCANWAEGPTHGGIKTDYAVDILWDYISEYENVNGATDYRKGFVQNFGETATGTFILRPSFEMPNALVGRMDISIAAGTASDNMVNKPVDGLFGAGLTTSLEPGASVPIWLKRTIIAGGSDPGSHLGIKVHLTASEQ